MFKGQRVKHPMVTCLSLAELDVLINLVPPTVTALRNVRFRVAFDSAEDYHTASLIIAALRMYDGRLTVSGQQR